MTLDFDASFLFSLFLIVSGSLITFFSYLRSKSNQFYSDTFLLLPFGVFVWGDGLILGPFWVLSGFFLHALSGYGKFQYVMIFFALRFFYEVIYWIVHQAASKSYRPPLFRNVTWLDAQQAAILYQLLNMIGVFVCLYAVFLSETLG